MNNLMEGDLLHRLDQPVSPYKSHVKNPMKIHQPFISRPYEIFLPTDVPSMGLLQAPPLSLRHSCRPYLLHPPPQPPLLPLPASHPRRSSSTIRPSANRNGNRIRDVHSFTLNKKSTKSPTKNPKKEEKTTHKRSSDITVSASSTSNSATDPKNLPKNIAKVSHFDSMSNTCNNDSSVIHGSGTVKDVRDQEDMLSGSVVFTISPPPSCLPLPTFSLRPKRGCDAVAAGIDGGASDDLRRLLRLQ